MVAAVADTHAALWHLYGDARLSARARDFIESSARVGQKVGVSTISLAEIVYLAEKQRIPATAFEDLSEAVADPDGVFQEIPLTQRIVCSMAVVIRQEVPDLPDRIVAATALQLGVPVISRDSRIRASSVQTVW
jgi:PIN domain nuclease of toxin-antitoxin system